MLHASGPSRTNYPGKNATKPETCTENLSHMRGYTGTEDLPDTDATPDYSCEEVHLNSDTATLTSL